jgi:hypothetical protein
MPDKQLNVWIPEDLRNYVAQRAEREKSTMNKIIAELIRQDMALRNGELVEENSLVILRELVAAELRQAQAQLRHDLREDRALETEAQRDWLKKQVDRLAGLLVMAVRNSSITRRLIYAVLSKSFGIDFAQKAYENAKEKAHQELLPKKAKTEHVPIEEDDAAS